MVRPRMAMASKGSNSRETKQSLVGGRQEAGVQPASLFHHEKENGDPNGNRTRAAAVKGRCPNR
jgi:hypothetical protein